MKVKKDISKLNLTDIDLGNTKIFINQSLCPYYKIYQSKHGLLKLRGQILWILREKIVVQDINVYLMNFQIMFSNM